MKKNQGVKSEIEIVIIPLDDDFTGGRAIIRVLKDGRNIIEGHIGGEPEDNTYYRDYNWVAPAFQALAEALGANAKTTMKEESNE